MSAGMFAHFKNDKNRENRAQHPAYSRSQPFRLIPI